MRKRIGRLVDLYRTKLKKKKYLSDFIKTSKNYLPVMVFQMGKVASSSIYYSIKNTYKGKVIHFHSFDNKDESFSIKTFYNYSVLDKQPTKIITLTREPVSRNISAFFQNFETITGKPFADSLYTIDELRTIFLENKKMNHYEPITWFEDNLLKNYNIDIYEKSFPHEGWQTLKKGNISVLIMKSEIDNGLKESLIKSFLNCEEFILSKHNIGEDKEYAAVYKKFRDSVKLPGEYLDRMLNSKYAQHFYTLKEIENSRNKRL
jgi:hypothetical protein